MSMGWFQGRRLGFNDTITYRFGIVAAVNPDAPPQPEGERPYTGHIVDFTDTAIGVRADGWWGSAPLYYVVAGDILSVEPYVARGTAEKERDRARLARRERDVPVPEPDTPEALVATLADWGAEYRPHQPCPIVAVPCTGPPPGTTCARSACRCHGSAIGAGSASPGCSHDGNRVKTQ